jgi:hypothetical protein
MHKRINTLFFIAFLAFVNLFLPVPARAGDPSSPSPADSLLKEKEMLARRSQLAEMESAILAYQRKQLDLELRDIVTQTKSIARKERELQVQRIQQRRSTGNAQGAGLPCSREVLKQRLENQDSLLAQARRQLEEERKNLDLQIENLKAERLRQELERKNFVTNIRQQDAKQKEQQRQDRAAALRNDLLACKQTLSQKEQEQKEQERMREEQRRKSAAAQREQERMQEEQRRDSSAALAEQKRRIAAQQQEISKAMEEEKRAGGQQSLQSRLDSLLEKQQKLLNISRQTEQDLRRQKEDVQSLLDHSRAATRSEEPQ